MSWGHAFYVMSPFRARWDQCCDDCRRKMAREIMYWNCKRGENAKEICVTCFGTRTLRGMMKYEYLPENWGRYDTRYKEEVRDKMKLKKGDEVTWLHIVKRGSSITMTTRQAKLIEEQMGDIVTVKYRSRRTSLKRNRVRPYGEKTELTEMVDASRDGKDKE